MRCGSTFGVDIELIKKAAVNAIRSNSDDLGDWRIIDGSIRKKAENLLTACVVCCEKIAYLSTSDAAFVNKWKNRSIN